jgi:hypothetical protein
MEFTLKEAIRLIVEKILKVKERDRFQKYGVNPNRKVVKFITNKIYKKLDSDTKKALLSDIDAIWHESMIGIISLQITGEREKSTGVEKVLKLFQNVWDEFKDELIRISSTIEVCKGSRCPSYTLSFNPTSGKYNCLYFDNNKAAWDVCPRRKLDF